MKQDQEFFCKEDQSGFYQCVKDEPKKDAFVKCAKGTICGCAPNTPCPEPCDATPAWEVCQNVRKKIYSFTPFNLILIAKA